MPDYAIGHNNLGNALLGRGRLEEAETHYRQALKLEPAYIDAQYNLSGALARLGKHTSAIDSYRATLALAPDHVRARNNLGNLLNAAGENAAALDEFRRALQINNAYAECYSNYVYSTRITADDPLIEGMRRLNAQELNITDRVHISYALGKAELDLGNDEAGIALLTRGGAAKKQQAAYTIERDVNLFNKIKKLNAEPATKLSPEAVAAPRPVFILGMPRSGTTLVEQIVCSHDQVFGGGELEILERAVTEEGTICSLQDQQSLGRVRQLYLQAISKLTDQPVSTDKTTLNFRYIGHILAALPEARIVHVRRQPMAVCWSNFRTYFPSPGMAFTCDQRDIAAYYHLYEDLMDFWESKFAGSIHQLDYDELTREPEQISRRLMDFLELDWQASQLQFAQNQRFIQTASTNQVRQDIYQDSSRAWQRYQPWLESMMNELGASEE